MGSSSVETDDPEPMGSLLLTGGTAARGIQVATLQQSITGPQWPLAVLRSLLKCTVAISAPLPAFISMIPASEVSQELFETGMLVRSARYWPKSPHGCYIGEPVLRMPRWHTSIWITLCSRPTRLARMLFMCV